MEEVNLIIALVILLRALIPLTILRWPLAGALLSIIADISDVMVYDLIGAGFLSNYSYHNVDKVFDMWYLFFEFIIVMTWKDKIARNIAAILFTWRFAGFLVFVLTGIRETFFFAPNIFEFFFLAVLLIWKFHPKFKFTWKNAAIVILIVGIPNIIKEYFMHFAFKDQTWNFFKNNLFWWMYD